MPARCVVAQHSVDELAEKIPFIGGETGQEPAAHSETAVLQSVRPASAGGRNLHQHLAADPTASMHQAIGFQSIDEADGRRMGEADNGGDLSYARRRVVGGGDQGGNSRWREIVIFGKRGIRDGQ